MDSFKKLSFLTFFCIFFINISYASATVVCPGQTIALTATASDSDCDYTAECPESKPDAVTVTWTAVWATPPNDDAGTFPGGSTGLSVSWQAPSSGSGDVKITAKGDDTGTMYPESDSDYITVTVVEVASLLPDEGTEFDDGDEDPNTKSYVVCIATSGTVTVTATPSPSVLEGDLPACWTLTGGTGSGKLSRTVDKTTDGKTVITCTSGSSMKETTIYVMDANILEPKGSKDANPNPTDSFLQTGPYRFDFQWVEVNVPGYYSNTIEGEILPASVISDLSAIDYFWSVSDGEFDPHDSGQTKKKSGTATPTYKATEIDSSITLTLDPNACPITRELETFQDHLARDYCNFGTDVNCSGSWQFTKYNVTITMGGTWNCHGSTRHHYDGAGSGSVGNIDFAAGSWDMIADVNEGEDLGTLTRGDIVAYYDKNSNLMHSQTITSGSTTYGANNEPVPPPGTPAEQSWKWATSTAGAWTDDVNDLWKPVKIKVYDKP